MKQTSVERIGRSQLIPGVLRTPMESRGEATSVMIGLEILLNGMRVCVAGAGEGVLSATVSSVAKRNELELDIGGLVDEAHLKWPAPRTLAIGDEVIVRVVETTQPDPPASTRRDDRALAEASERKYYERLKRKYEGKG